MKVVQINSVCGSGSTGRIAAELHAFLTAQGEQSMVAFGRGNAGGCDKTIRIGSAWDVYRHVAIARLFDRNGFGSHRATVKFIKQLQTANPDIIHLHNIHGYYLDIEELFTYLKSTEKPVVWTLHDCWSFTGHCAYFDYVGCNRWRNEKGCYDCPQKKEYPKRLWHDASARNYADKKRLFTGVKNLTLVTPSAWLAQQVKQSFLAEYPIRVIPNGIDIEVLRPIASDFRERYGIRHNEFVCLGVANVWEKRKGLCHLIELAKRFGEGCRFVIVGLTEKQKACLPSNVIGITRTNSIKELAEIYSAADVFVNTTLEDNFPTTNLESLACGTPVITFRTGGSTESVDECTGLIVDKGDVDALENAVWSIRESTKEAYTSACVQRAHEKYNKQNVYKAYTQLYRSIM